MCFLTYSTSNSPPPVLHWLQQPSQVSVTWLVRLVSAECCSNNSMIFTLLCRTASWRGVSPSWGGTKKQTTPRCNTPTGHQASLWDSSTYFVLRVDLSFALNQMFHTVDVSGSHSNVERSAVNLHSHTVTRCWRDFCVWSAAATSDTLYLPCLKHRSGPRGPAAVSGPGGFLLGTPSADTWTTAGHNHIVRSRAGKSLALPS